MSTGKDAPAPETDLFVRRHACEEYLHPVDDAYNKGLRVCADLARRLERERNELRDLYKLDTQCLRAERNEARAELRRCHNEYIEVSHNREAKMETLQSSHDAAWRRYNETDAAYQAALDENQALRAALRVAAGQRGGKHCPECGLDSAHFDDCRHHATESKVMQ
jgi:hypothetical protein